MNIEKNCDGTSLTAALEGRLDTHTSVRLEAELKDSIDGVTELIFDLEKLDYISSAGMRVMLALKKAMEKHGGSIKVRNVSPEIMEIFDMTGFSEMLTIE